jgi:hypothetical protein
MEFGRIFISATGMSSYSGAAASATPALPGGGIGHKRHNEKPASNRM